VYMTLKTSKMRMVETGNTTILEIGKGNCSRIIKSKEC